MSKLENQSLNKDGVQKGLHGADFLKPVTSKQPQKTPSSGDQKRDEK
ncbi:MAG: hypothetical protein P4N59_05620 [Negativicutes bacterium]|nr:hypothetical protein [Negativicutes bacterium]